VTKPCTVQGFFVMIRKEVAFRYNLLKPALSQA